jgi:hypothetical protein
MKTGLLYAFFVMLTLILVSSDQKERGQIEAELSTSQLVNVHCVVPEVIYSQKKDNSALNFVRLIIESYYEDTYYQIFKFSDASNKCYLTKAVDLKPITQKPFRQKVHYTSETQDSSDLS